ncbi:MAG: class I SAM-dependent methyltransferase [Deltaproteobacteria bacterium]|nr:class I SAM-dependent methyltransferase [Deltaproteobacteria bacterium]
MKKINKKQKIAELVKKHVKPGSRVLEVSCGHGKILEELDEAGYMVKGTNYSKYPDACKSVDIDFGIDINAGLPYEDDVFDCVILCDVIEHFPNHIATIQEISRVLKKGGYSVILTPNTMKIASRLHFLFTGFFKLKRAFIGFDVPADKAFVFHNNPPHLPVFLYHLHSHYLESVNVYGVNYKFKSFLFWLLLAPLIIPFTYSKTSFMERNMKNAGGGELLFSRLTSFETLNAEYWIAINQKVDPSLTEPVLKSKLPSWAEKSV